MIKNFLCDVDGRLFDTYAVITYAMSKTLLEMELSVPLNVIYALARESLEYCLESLSQRFKLGLDLLRIRFAESYQAVPLANQQPFPGACGVYKQIHRIDGLNVIVTQRAVSFTRSMLDAHSMFPLFDVIFSVEQNSPRKADPALLEAALQHFELEKAETSIISNRALDIQVGWLAFAPVSLAKPSYSSQPVTTSFITINCWRSCTRHLHKAADLHSLSAPARVWDTVRDDWRLYRE